MEPAPVLLTPKDVPLLHELIRGCYAAYDMIFSLEDPAEAHLIDPVKAFQGSIWCIRDSESHATRLRASAALSVNQDSKAGEIKTVYVHPIDRRQGLGRLITNHAITYARSRCIKDITLWSDTRFTAAHALYESMGFVRSGERDCNDHNHSREYGYRLPSNRITDKA